MSIDVVLCATFLWGGFAILVYREWKIETGEDKK